MESENKIVTTEINGQTFELSTKLIVAYKAQGANNHKPYLEVFKDIGNMPLEKQIEILFLAFQAANPEIAKTFNQQTFLNYYLDHFTLKEVMTQLQGVIKGIIGDDEEETDQGNAKTSLNLE